jgi:hypothetical protein
MPSLEDASERYVYAIKSGRFIKIGVALSIAKRVRDMRLLNPHEIVVVYRRKMRAAFHCEKKMHEVLRDKAVGREWFEASVEEVKAAATIGLAYAREVRSRTTKNYYYSVTPVTHEADANYETLAITSTS